MTPILKLRANCAFGPAPSVISTLPPPMSMTTVGLRRVDAVDGGHVDQPRFLGAGDDARADAGGAFDGGEELAAVFGLARGAGGRGENLVDLVRPRESLEFRQRLQRRGHRLVRQLLAVQPAGAQPDHFLLAIDDLEREVRPDTDHDHVNGVGADVDGCETHRCDRNVII